MRVAGRRSDLATDDARSVSVRADPFATLCVAAEDARAPDVPADESDMAMVVDVVAEAAVAAGWTAPSVPWPGRLEENIALESAWSMMQGRSGIPMGVVDLPDSQARAAWTLEESDDHLLLMGGARADLNGALTTLAMSAALGASPDDLHIYVIDFAGRGLGDLGDLPHCGAVSVRNDALSSRILTYLTEEASRRRSVLAEARAGSLEELRRRMGQTFPRILLLIAGADRLHPSQGNEGGSPLVGAVNAVVAESIGLGIHVVMAGLPKIATLRPGSLIDRRLGFVIPSVADYASPSFPRELLVELGPPRRAIDMQRGTMVEICTLGGGAVDESDAMAAFLERLALQPVAPVRRPPQQFVEVSWPFRIGGFLSLVGSERRPKALPVAVANATGTPVWIDADEDSSHWLVAGGPKSGRSYALSAIGSIAARRGWDVIGVCFATASRLRSVPGVTIVEPRQLVEAMAVPRSRPLLLLIDDVHRTDPAALGKIVESDAATLTVISGSPATFSGMAFRPYEALGLRAPKHGFLLAPSGSLDPLSARRESIRPDLVASRRQGHGLIGIHGELTEITVPFIDRS